MKAANVLLRIGGVANCVFFLFHLLLGWRIHQLKVDPRLRALLDMFNGGGAVFIAFLAFASLACARDMLTTRLGHTLLVVASAFYFARALCEMIVTPKFGAPVFLACFVTGAIFGTAFVRVRRSQRSAIATPSLLPIEKEAVR